MNQGQTPTQALKKQDRSPRFNKHANGCEHFLGNVDGSLAGTT
jgi:hypothetical protein